MTDDATIIFLEADDEITGVVRRVRDAGPGRVVIVAPGRSRATSSTVALRVLARAGDEDGAELAVVGDMLTRSLAADAGLAAYASVEDARAALPVEVAEARGELVLPLVVAEVERHVAHAAGELVPDILQELVARIDAQ